MDAWSSSRERALAHRRRWVPVLVGAAIVLAAVSAVVVAAQVEVTEPEFGLTRTCGSVFDSVADRSGWETWWARDLDEGDPAVRTALVRTTDCPDAINLQLAIGASLAGIAGILAFLAVAMTTWRPGPSARSDAGDRLLRLGRVTSYVGAALTIVGLVALVLLVADADSTLFLYTDRLVVGVVGLIVLVPTVALVVIGRALMILGESGRSGSSSDTGGDGIGSERIDV